jgi:magnesium-transporting ATPase (P-type)
MSKQTSPTTETDWHFLASEEVKTKLDVNTDEGLTSDEAKKRQEQYGTNELKFKTSRIPFWLRLLIRHTFNFLVLVLVVAGILSLAVQSWIDAGVIAAVILINVSIGFFQEFKSEQTMQKLKQMSTPKCRVNRNHKVVEIESKELVPGDIVLLKMGDRVPADIRLFRVNGLECNEAILTGESVPVAKIIDPIEKSEEEVPLGDRYVLSFLS